MITGSFQGTTDFDSGTGTEWRNSSGSLIKLPDVYLAKYDSDGKYQDVQIWGANESFETVDDIAISDKGKIFVAGTYGNLTDFNPDPILELFLVPAGSLDIWISIFSSNGSFINAISIGGEGTEIVNAICVDTDGNLYVTGKFYDTSDFDPGPDNAYRTSNGGYDCFVMKLNSDMEFLWVTTFGSEFDDSAYDIEVNSDGDAFITGTFRDSVDFEPGPGTELISSNNDSNDVFLLKLLSNGLWE